MKNTKFEQFQIRPVTGGYITFPADPRRHPLLSQLHHDGPVDKLLETDLTGIVRRIRKIGKDQGMTVIVCGAQTTAPTLLLKLRTPDQRSPKPRKGWINTLADVGTRLYEVNLEGAKGKLLDERKDKDASEITNLSLIHI